ncbi:MAG: peroxiredoxin [Candidatus Kariarchaeaceae archaeon]
MINLGDNFPAFKLTDQNGKIITSEELKGGIFVLFSYPRALTPGCTNEVCSIRDAFTVLQERGVTPLGISNDSITKNKKFSDKYELQYSLLSDEDNVLLTKLGAYGEKILYGKKSWGTFRFTWIVDKEFKIVKIFKTVKTKVHGEEILTALDNLNL